MPPQDALLRGTQSFMGLIPRSWLLEIYSKLAAWSITQNTFNANTAIQNSS